MSTGRILITGAAGFVGSALARRLSQEKIAFTAGVLAGEDLGDLPAKADLAIMPSLAEAGDYSRFLEGVDIVVHLAARAHVLQERAAAPLGEFLKVNFHGTERLARQAAASGVKRFVFISTIGVNGNNSRDAAFVEDDPPAPHNNYSISKYRAELSLREISGTTGLETVIIRAPLVYGPGVKGNLLRLMRHISHGLPLPVSSMTNRRSLISLDNLVDILMLSSWRKECAGNTYVVCDGEDISTGNLIRMIAGAMGRSERLITVPEFVFTLVADVLPGLKPALESYAGSLYIDGSKFRRMLNWEPRHTMQEGIRSMVSRFLRDSKHAT